MSAEDHAGLGGWQPLFGKTARARFERIDRDLMAELGELKKAIAAFDSYRHAWAEIVANNVAPGRDSEFTERLEVMQGEALSELDAAAWRLRLKIRNESEAP